MKLLKDFVFKTFPEDGTSTNIVAQCIEPGWELISCVGLGGDDVIRCAKLFLQETAINNLQSMLENHAWYFRHEENESEWQDHINYEKSILDLAYCIGKEGIVLVEKEWKSNYPIGTDAILYASKSIDHLWDDYVNN